MASGEGEEERGRKTYYQTASTRNEEWNWHRLSRVTRWKCERMGFAIPLFPGPNTEQSGVTPAGWHRRRVPGRAELRGRHARRLPASAPRELKTRLLCLVVCSAVCRLGLKKTHTQGPHREVQRTPGPPILTAWLP